MTPFHLRLPVRATTLMLAVAASLPLAGCISFGAKPPKQLLTLQAADPVPVGPERDGATSKAIVVAVPSTPAAIAVQRVPVQTGPTSLAYVKDALWAEPPARLFARLVSDTIAAKSGRIVLSAAQAIGESSDQLDGELRQFGLDADRRQAVVTFDAALLRDGATQIEKRRFEARVPVGAIDAANAGTAINQAANQVAAEVAAWVGR